MTEALELPTSLSDAEFRRFIKFVDWSADPAECWFWLGATNSSGYGSFWLRGRVVTAHRLGWQLQNGAAVPAGMQLDHTCRSRGCANPSHLEVVTNAENGRRGDKAKLTPFDVQLIRLVGDALPQREVGDAFGVSHQAVGRVLSRTVQPGQNVAAWHDTPDVDLDLVLSVVAAVRELRTVA